MKTGQGNHSWGGGLVVGERLDDARVADRDDLRLGKAAEVGPHADPADADHRGQDPQQVDGNEIHRIFVVLEYRQDVVTEVDQDDEGDPGADDERGLQVRL